MGVRMKMGDADNDNGVGVDMGVAIGHLDSRGLRLLPGAAQAAGKLAKAHRNAYTFMSSGPGRLTAPQQASFLQPMPGPFGSQGRPGPACAQWDARANSVLATNGTGKRKRQAAPLAAKGGGAAAGTEAVSMDVRPCTSHGRMSTPQGPSTGRCRSMSTPSRSPRLRRPVISCEA